MKDCGEGEGQGRRGKRERGGREGCSREEKIKRKHAGRVLRVRGEGGEGRDEVRDVGSYLPLLTAASRRPHNDHRVIYTNHDLIPSPVIEAARPSTATRRPGE